jgi:hypothetical protein
MKVAFELEWMGGVAEHHFLARRVVEEDILAPLSQLGVTLTHDERQSPSA